MINAACYARKCEFKDFVQSFVLRKKARFRAFFQFAFLLQSPSKHLQSAGLTLFAITMKTVNAAVDVNHQKKFCISLSMTSTLDINNKDDLCACNLR